MGEIGDAKNWPGGEVRSANSLFVEPHGSVDQLG